MEWMSPIDSSFLHIENDTTPMHIGGVSIFEGPPPPFDDLRAMVAGKLELVPRYRQKVRFVPLAAGPPVWIDDPHFSLDHAAGTLRSLAEIARAGASAGPSLRPVAASSLTGPIGPHRRWSWGKLRLADVKTVRSGLGGTASRQNGAKRASAAGQNGHKPATAPVR
jgi:hypothetical protein